MRITLSDSTPVVREILNDDTLTVGVAPSPSSTILVEFSLSSEAELKAGDAIWFEWAKGAVSEKTVDDFPATITALRFTATVGTGVVEYLGLRNLK